MTSVLVKYVLEMKQRGPGGKWFEVDESADLEWSKKRYNNLVNSQNRDKKYKLRLIKRTIEITNGVIFSE